MKKTYRTAMGKQLDIDSLRIANEETIAVGNMKVNARGDKLGSGGQVIESRNQTMSKVYGSTVLQDNNQSREEVIKQQRQQGVKTTRSTVVSQPKEPVVEQPVEDPNLYQAPDVPEDEDTGPTLRGSLADSLAKSTTVNQELITPPSKRGPSGPSRI